DWGNHDDWVLMLPEDPDASARRLRAAFERASGAAVGVLVIDSHGRAWRVGTVGVAIGVAGLPGVLDLRGRPDLYGYQLQTTDVGFADELAAAASALMGQAGEGTPVVHLRGVPYPLRDGSVSELLRPESQDLFRD
ncbi:MAG: coenzyme F420-0:L-glutamate ligase, partial [Chloroflexi bacterium]|nr:coenzyme F420-0:L-glutamate ligase [Chloroflexota bacterium]